LAGQLEIKKPLGIIRHRWVDNIKIDFKEKRCLDLYGLEYRSVAVFVNI
jgi:hypothetical protein